MSDDSTAKGRRVRKSPAVIQRRQEMDPADTAVADVATPEATGDSDTGRDATRRQATPDAATADGDSDTGRRHQQRHGDTTRDSDMATQRQATRGDVATGDTGDNPGPVAATATQEGDSDMTPAATATPPARRRRTKATPAPPPGAPAGATPDGEAAEEMRPISFTMPPSLIGRLRAAQHHTQLKSDGFHNMSELVRAAVDETVTYLEQTYNRGRPFPPVEKLRTGPSPAGAVRGAQVRARKRRGSAQDVEDAGPRRTRQADTGEENPAQRATKKSRREGREVTES